MNVETVTVPPLAIATAPAVPPDQPVPATQPVLDAQIGVITMLKADLGLQGEAWKEKLSGWGVTSAKQMNRDQAGELIRDLQHLLACRALEGPDGLPVNPAPDVLRRPANGATFQQPATAPAR